MADQQQAEASSNSSPSSSGGIQGHKQAIQARLQTNKHLVLKLQSYLTWEQDYYPIVIGAAISFLFLMIYLLDKSVLTTISLMGIVLTLLDYSLPILSKSLLNGSKWTEKDTQKFDKICLDLAKSYLFMRSGCDFMKSLKQKRPIYYYVSLSTTFLILAWVGNQFNNLFLTYLLTLLIVFYPGLDKRNVPQKIFESVASKLARRPTGSAGDRKSNSGRK